LHLNVAAGLVAYGSDDEDDDNGEDDSNCKNEGPRQPTHLQHAQPLTVPGVALPQRQHQQHTVRSQPPSESMSPDRPPVRSPSPLEEKPKPRAAPVALTGAAQLRTGTVTALVPTSLLIRRQAVEQRKKVFHFSFLMVRKNKQTTSNNPFLSSASNSPP